MEEITKIFNFLSEIGIEIREEKLENDTFLPGLTLKSNAVVVDLEKLKYPGDLLHEAGHIAVTSPENRSRIGTPEMDQNWPDGGEEMAAILWSYAAALHLNLPLEFVFHPDGYKNESEWLISNFEKENYVGLPFLEWIGLTYGKENAIKNDTSPFPVMQKWIRN
ncbi:hypothetical protein NAT51_06980 [Flavobacterium amniphilum]|uniref:hypothetical protein n=1 Tax=Flavobacterium amniphilum TaxID=1834035 RepID=UPI002029D226|nr:hypothetical protein [Flavobacterium amniphilum]MCL9805257.1 hypothetical protein [Flavobacterium amniphilum]